MISLSFVMLTTNIRVRDVARELYNGWENADGVDDLKFSEGANM